MDNGSGSGTGPKEETGILELIPQVFVTLGLLFPWMTRKYLLWEIDFSELMLYYVLGTREHLKLAGIYVSPTNNREVSIDEESDHEALYNQYKSRSFDASTLEGLI